MRQVGSNSLPACRNISRAAERQQQQSITLRCAVLCLQRSQAKQLLDGCILHGSAAWGAALGVQDDTWHMKVSFLQAVAGMRCSRSAA
jgi:hypothetical protein